MNNWLKDLIKRSKLWIFPGTDGLPLYDILRLFYKGIMNGAINSRASSMSFNFFLALFPGIIFLFTLIPYILGKNFQEQLLNIIFDIMPTSAYNASKNTIIDIVRHQRGGLLSISFLIVIYFSTSGVNATVEAFNKSYHITRQRSFFKQKTVALIFTIFLSILLLVAITLMVLTESSIEYFMRFDWIKDKWLLQIIVMSKWLIILALFYCSISFLYHFAPSKRIRWRFFNAGSIMATFLTVLVSGGFSYFVNNFGQYNKVYGSIGTLVVILLWIYFNSYAILLGFELNASIIAFKHSKAMSKATHIEHMKEVHVNKLKTPKPNTDS
jgi:membrane protein